MELTPLERRIKANALWAIRKRFRDGIPEFKTNILVLGSLHSNGAFDQIFYDKKTGEFAVQYEVYKDEKTGKTETRWLKFTLPQYQLQNKITILKEDHVEIKEPYTKP